MRIGELAARTGASARSLRHYEAAGLIGPERLANGYRNYEASAVEQVRKIQALLRAGFSLTDSRGLVSCVVDGQPKLLHCAESARAVNGRLAQLDQRIAELTEVRCRLAAALESGGVSR